MKLIDILVEELTNHGGWPDGAVFVAQEEGGELWSFTSKPQKDCDDEWMDEWMDESHHGYHTKVGKLTEASDHDVSTITREQYEAALAAKNDGWIEWGGGKHPPVSTNTVVDVKFKNGNAQSGYPAGEYSWEHVWQDCNIIAYRLHKPTKSEQVRAAAWNSYAGITMADDESDLNECIGQDAAPVWNGEGLPPVGMEIEYSFAKVNYRTDFSRGKVLAYGMQNVFMEHWASKNEFIQPLDKIEFRPIRSAEDEKRDDRASAIDGFISGFRGQETGSNKELAYALTDYLALLDKL